MSGKTLNEKAREAGTTTEMYAAEDAIALLNLSDTQTVKVSLVKGLLFQCWKGLGGPYQWILADLYSAGRDRGLEEALDRIRQRKEYLETSVRFYGHPGEERRSLPPGLIGMLDELILTLEGRQTLKEAPPPLSTTLD